MENIFTNIPALLLAENGYYLKDNKRTKNWTKTQEMHLTWMDSAEKMVYYFVKRTPGSFIERLETSIYWYYAGCVGAFSEKQARDLIRNLQMGPLINTPTEVIHDQLNKFVKVQLIALNKSYAVKISLSYFHVLSKYEKDEKLSEQKFEFKSSSWIEHVFRNNGQKIIYAYEEIKKYNFILFVGNNFELEKDDYYLFNKKSTSKKNPLLR
ncbi:threalose-6-phosphate phosphatase, partial [Bonamia ostreae]